MKAINAGIRPFVIGCWLTITPALVGAGEQAADGPSPVEMVYRAAKSPEGASRNRSLLRREGRGRGLKANVHHQMELSYSHCRTLVALDRWPAKMKL